MPRDGTDALNEYLQRKGRLHSLSWQVRTTGPTHSPTWTCTCKINGEVKSVGTGTHQTAAKNMAANIALEALIEGEETENN
ncbi:hypothetical protein CONPUDRAFT_149147 [Coniophora puteana RWD-64-598 SS2]|uniref:DRBM domain-containing protein n=1 Tax=Coniophora puteana (strain RWD-64-598) TaxID=741705 RepID=A0A5M3N7G7_CONPW|nr:uncharacterized protein CONPUDRAFT_149147 [Coniophora puteana RWD-64-598 SS2]EIW87107.1 hypothetical protein CONPUDRAFT_149147 [Coniophora puteana RWD-64-598 SS2]